MKKKQIISRETIITLPRSQTHQDLGVWPRRRASEAQRWISHWWLTYPPEKYEFVRLDHHPNYWGFKKKKKHVPKPPTKI